MTSGKITARLPVPTRARGGQKRPHGAARARGRARYSRGRRVRRVRRLLLLLLLLLRRVVRSRAPRAHPRERDPGARSQ
eukprot:29243-Pelagococcus_subviridis.AAC.5